MALRPRRSGFTLLELMVVVTIVGIAAAAAAPGVMAAMEERRASNAAVDVVRLARRARMEPVASGRAYLLAFDADGGLGRLRLFRGRNDRCNTQVWTLQDPIDQVALIDYSPGGAARGVQLTPQVPVDICYEPNGAMLMRAPGGGAFGWTVAGITSGVLLTVRRTPAAGVPRQVVLPLGGSARMVR